MQQQTAKRLTAIVGVSMAVIMGLSVVLPYLGRNAGQQTITQPPTEAPIPTFPPPVDTSTISFDQLYLHPTGLFTVVQPEGWSVAQPSNNSQNARVTFTNPDALSVIQVDVDKPAAPDGEPLTLDDVNAQFTSTSLASSWSRYSDWEETGPRKRDNDRLSMDFRLELNRQTYVARQVAWTDGEWIYSVRVVTPENATEQLLYLLDNVAATLQPNKELATTPFDWNAHVDTTARHIVRFPPAWTLADSAPGLPASITGTGDVTLRVETEGGTVNDEDAARAWVEAHRPGATILSVQPVTRGETSGYAVTYTFKTVDGESQSGQAVLLNGDSDTLHVANLRFPGADIDLNAAETQQTYADFSAVMNSFAVLPESVVLPQAEATAEAAS